MRFNKYTLIKIFTLFDFEIDFDFDYNYYCTVFSEPKLSRFVIGQLVILIMSSLYIYIQFTLKTSIFMILNSKSFNEISNIFDDENLCSEIIGGV